MRCRLGLGAHNCASWRAGVTTAVVVQAIDVALPALCVASAAISPPHYAPHMPRATTAAEVVHVLPTSTIIAAPAVCAATALNAGCLPGRPLPQE